MTGERSRSERRDPHSLRPEITLARQTEQRWTLTDGKGCINANVETFVEVRR